MTNAGFDVLVIAFTPRAQETAGSALSRIVGMAAAQAEALCRALPCVVLSDVGYAQAESVAASLSLAGAEASVRPHVDEPAALEEAARMTMPEIAGVQLPPLPQGLGAAREGSVRPAPAPGTLRPPNVSDAEPALVFASSARVAVGAGPVHDVGQLAEGPARPGMETVREVASLPQAAPPPVAGSETVDAPPEDAASAASPVGQSWALELDLAPKPPPSQAQAQDFASDFGKGLELELVATPRARPALPASPAPMVPEAPEAPASLDGPPRLSLGFQLSFPRDRPAARAAAVAAASVPAALETATVRPAPRAAPTGASQPARVAPSAAPSRRAPVPRPLLEADGTITRRTLYLLAMLWVSVGLLLWTHDLL